MKKVKAVFGICLASLLALAGIFPVGAAKKTVSKYSDKTIAMSDAAGMYKTQGRTGQVGDGLSIDWSGSGIEFNADCEGNVTLNLKIQSWLQDTFFTVVVDGNTMDRLEADTSSDDTEDVQLNIASDLPQGEHSFCFYNQTECIVALVSIESIELCGQLTEPPANKDLLIEYVGDSYLTGYGCLVNGNDENSYPRDKASITDGSQSLGVLTSRELQADYSIVAISGYGLICGVDGRDANMTKYYDYVSWQRSHTDSSDDAWDFSRQPDIIVIELGDNDRCCAPSCGVSNEEFRSAAKTFAEHVRDENPKAKIVWMMYGYEKEITGALNELGGNSAGYYVTTLEMGSDGALGHPTAGQLHEDAGKLANYLKENILLDVSSSSDVSSDNQVDSEIESASDESSSEEESNPSPTTKPTIAPDTGDSSRNIIPWLIVFDTVALITAIVLCRKKKMSD